jgi:hypothetical protein
MHAFLAGLDAGDRQGALDFVDAADSREVKLAETRIDMMLAISKLKKAVAARWGAVAPFDLQMTVVGENECGSIKEQVDGDKAIVEVISSDNQQAPTSYSMIYLANGWKISFADETEAIRNDAVFAEQMKAALHLKTVIQDTTNAVVEGRMKSVQEVQEKISESMTP